ncbi:MAG: winged helix-turn-helix transcriptional regulator [Candidatus Eisenbacteria bacterium]|uniref:Winged helix-turn-helix transcriptional regulator n=1 Tax=Eiseniibacteriota bacterium TaxID=2212470 RepID=A0A7Y2H0V3_UNCEI|nr:winged helix-turn-helix transcriptional regulator [Candidatus Eisenbacteria bacterium]
MHNSTSITSRKSLTNISWLTTAFKALSDPTRLRILRLLAANKAEMCVCEFVDVHQVRQYTVSRALGLLEQAGLVLGQKEGRWVYYSLANQDDTVIASLYTLVTSISEADEVFLLDQERFQKRMALREDGRCIVGIQTRDLIER